jgi:hypothetical protein
MVMLYNAWRLNALHALSKNVDWERCVTRKQQLGNTMGKPFVEFLKKLFHTVEIANYFTWKWHGTYGRCIVSPTTNST